MPSPSAFAATFDDFEMLIYDSVHDFRRKYGTVGTFESMMDEAFLQFVKAYVTWRRERAEFSTWLRFVITKGFLDIRRQFARRMTRQPTDHAADLNDIASRERFNLKDFTAQLSDDAQYAVHVALSIDFNDRCSRLNKRRRIYKTLLNKGWDMARIESTFTEIGEAL